MTLCPLCHHLCRNAKTTNWLPASLLLPRPKLVLVGTTIPTAARHWLVSNLALIDHLSAELKRCLDLTFECRLRGFLRAAQLHPCSSV